MALVKCKECSREISAKAQACPGCGSPQFKKPIQVSTGAGGCLIVVIMFGAIAYFLGDSATSPRRAESPEQVAAREQRNREANWIAAGQQAVKAKLKDPDSAQFRNVYFSNAGGVPVACGEVNSRNSFGGMGGFQRFIGTSRPELTFLEEEVSDFATAWNRFCVKKAP